MASFSLYWEHVGASYVCGYLLQNAVHQKKMEKSHLDNKFALQSFPAFEKITVLHHMRTSASRTAQHSIASNHNMFMHSKYLGKEIPLEVHPGKIYHVTRKYFLSQTPRVLWDRVPGREGLPQPAPASDVQAERVGHPPHAAGDI